MASWRIESMGLAMIGVGYMLVEDSSCVRMLPSI